MFFYPAVLQRHSGCFSIIWLVATKGIKVPRKDFLKVNVIRTCDDIMDYVLERVPPPQPGLPRPRFSLYLSSQLQYGVIVVFHRQCAILLDEIQYIVTKLLKKRSSQNIDIKDSRSHLVLPDVLSMMEEAEAALDPLFGVMQDVMPSPRTLLEMNWEYQREASPEHPERHSPVTSELGSGITASQESITMREPEPVAFPAPEFEGAELDDHPPDILDMLLAQTDDFPEEEPVMPREAVTPEEPERELEREADEGDHEKELTKEPTPSSIELQPTTTSSEDVTLLPQEEPGPRIDWMTPISTPSARSSTQAAEGRRRLIRSLGLEDLSPPVTPIRRRRRRRQLIFFDPETQLSEEVQQQQLNNPLIETRAPDYLPPSHLRMPSAAQLFNNPCCAFLPEEIQVLWRQAANITPILGLNLQVGERGIESTDSEREREQEMMEAAEREERRLSPEEILKLAAEAEMFEISAQGSLPLEASDQKDVSREMSPMYTPEKEGSTVSRSVSALQGIPEAEQELPQQTTPESEGLLPELPEHELVIFQSLLPPDVDRRTVSNIFLRLLGHLSSRKVRAVQHEPYGDIIISPGANSSEVHLSP
ncbi:meiotic recombination protein REC8 homolog isoform X2 [Gouania willdenowi]|uniref:meiotic recombination protein REC8 homolog isoform X2 n=1 Tax=Gouania willdenowi TaxID=441366 RepID=UPI00105620E2|nr:meiotic recombination protein REC8 homolog isoform X2 [Gouania willdenowi]